MVHSVPKDLQDCITSLRSHSSLTENYHWGSSSSSIVPREDWSEDTILSSLDKELSTALRILKSQTSLNSRISGSRRETDADISGQSLVSSESDFDTANLERPSVRTCARFCEHGIISDAISPTPMQIGEKMFQFARVQNQSSASSSRCSRQVSLDPSSPDNSPPNSEFDSFDEKDDGSSIYNNSSVNDSPCPDRRRPLSMISTNAADLSPRGLDNTFYDSAAAMSTPPTGKAVVEPQTPYQKMFNPLEVFQSRKDIRDDGTLPQHLRFTCKSFPFGRPLELDANLLF